MTNAQGTTPHKPFSAISMEADEGRQGAQAQRGGPEGAVRLAYREVRWEPRSNTAETGETKGRQPEAIRSVCFQ